MEFFGFLLRRILAGIFVLWAVTLGTFLLFFVIPTDPAKTLAGKAGTPSMVANIRQRLGLDQPILIQYWHYLDRLVHGNLGTSFFQGISVNHIIWSDLPPTLSLIVGGVVLWLAVGLTVGVISAVRPRSIFDRVATAGVLAAYSMPAFVIGLGLLFFLYYLPTRANIHIFQPNYMPLTQSAVGWLQRMVLPWITLAALTAASYTRLTRGSLLDTLGEDYIRTARAKGLPERRVVLRHGLRAALTPVVSQLGVDVGMLIGGTIVTETVFGLGGIGQLIAQSVIKGDVPIVLGVVLLTAACVVVANILVDIGYSILDPRVRVT